MEFIHTLHERALEAARRFKQAEADLIDIFQTLEETRAFSKLGYASLFDYGLKALGFSEANTYSFIQIARKSKTVPALKAAIQAGRLSVCKAKRIVSVITPENQSDWIAKAETLSKSSLEREVARVNPVAVTEARARYVSENRLELKLGVSDELMNKLKRIQDLESQRTRKAASLEATLEELAELYLEKNDPVRKLERARSTILCPGTNEGRRIPSATRHVLTARDQSQCAHIYEDGKRCTQRRWLEVHHKKPVSQGGDHSVRNLTTLCFEHHRYRHRERGARQA